MCFDYEEDEREGDAEEDGEYAPMHLALRGVLAISDAVGNRSVLPVHGAYQC